MRKFLTCISAMAVLAMLSAPAVLAGPTIDRIMEKKVLVIGTSGEMPPLTFKTRDGKTAGLDIEIGKLIARAVDAECRIVTLPFTELIPALEKGKIDLVISAMTITPQRNLRIAYVGPYMMTGQSLLTTKEAAGAIRGPADMNRSDFTVAVSRGTTSEGFMNKQFPNASLTLVKSKKEAIALLLQDKVKAIVADYPFCKTTALRHLDRGLVANPPFTLEPLGIGVRADDPLFVNLLQNFINLLQMSGEIKKMSEPWFEDSSWMQMLPPEEDYI